MAVLQKLKGNLAGAAKGIKSGSPKGHKTRLVLLALLFTLAFCVFVTATLFANSSYVPQDNVQELNYKRSQVFVGGTGYTLTNYKRKQHDLEEEERSSLIEDEPDLPEDEEEEEEERPELTTNHNSTSPYRRTYPGTYSPSTSTYPHRTYPYSYNRYNNNNNNNNNQTNKNKKKKKEKESEYDKKKKEISKDPKIKVSGIKSGSTVKGKTKTFTIRGYSYEGDEITGSGLVVKLNGTKLKPIKEHKYKGTIKDGTNKLVITVTDGSGNKKSKTIKFKGVIDSEPEKIGSLSVGVSAEVLGIDLVAPMETVDIFENEQLSDVVKRYFKEFSGVGTVAKDSSYYALQRIKMEGILDGIPEDIVEQLDELGIPVPEDKDSLGNDDFGPGSGWVYKVDGKIVKNYMSDVEPGDESTVEIYYTIPELE